MLFQLLNEDLLKNFLAWRVGNRDGMNMSHSRDWNVLPENPVHKLNGVDIAPLEWHVEALPDEELVESGLIRDKSIKHRHWVVHFRLVQNLNDNVKDGPLFVASCFCTTICSAVLALRFPSSQAYAQAAKWANLLLVRPESGTAVFGVHRDELRNVPF